MRMKAGIMKIIFSLWCFNSYTFYQSKPETLLILFLIEKSDTFTTLLLKHVPRYHCPFNFILLNMYNFKMYTYNIFSHLKGLIANLSVSIRLIQCSRPTLSFGNKNGDKAGSCEPIRSSGSLTLQHFISLSASQSFHASFIF